MLSPVRRSDSAVYNLWQMSFSDNVHSLFNDRISQKLVYSESIQRIDNKRSHRTEYWYQTSCFEKHIQYEAV